MKLIRLDNIRHEAGHCHVAALADSVPPGEAIGRARKSALQLFEARVQLGSGSASHEQIRLRGQGSYSHWGSSLYFSTGDNADSLLAGWEYLSW